ncbi:hypothetical protein DFH08DRAFT_984386 [Mycena albidolilacea]|uniref:Uncharacterized protein n=1 Tax=Mycena albidolilacea TaxID=1033008 RepID=A0AAD7EVX0_9AGAR|nr:hypothetical protein DFH08DRAFT_984386 [Mycena albidolilacea]
MIRKERYGGRAGGRTAGAAGRCLRLVTGTPAGTARPTRTRTRHNRTRRRSEVEPGRVNPRLLNHPRVVQPAGIIRRSSGVSASLQSEARATRKVTITHKSVTCLEIGPSLTFGRKPAGLCRKFESWKSHETSRDQSHRHPTSRPVGPTYPHPIIADKALLLRRRNTQCLALDEVVHTFHPPPSTAPMHFRQNLPAERKALRTVYKGRHSPKPIIIDDTPSSDSDVEVVRVNKRAFKQEYEDDSVLRHAQRPRLDPDLIIDTELPSPSAALSPPWPAGMYVVDMVKGFRKISGLKGMGLNRGQRFHRVFGIQYHASTFDAQHSKYKAATPTQIEAGVQAGRTDKGLWNVWRKTV